MRRIVRRLLLLVPAPLLAAHAAVPPSASVSPAEQTAAATIDAAVLRAHVKFLASDLLEGRGPATRGDRLAQAYVASQLEAAGLAPAAPEGGWIQKVPLVGMTPKIPGTVTFAAGSKKLELETGADFVAFPGVQQPQARWSDAEVVFVGYGIVAPEFRWDDFKDADVKGKVLLVMNNDPEDDPNLFAGKTRLRYGRWDYKYEQAAKKGAAGVVIIHTTHSAGYPWQVVQASYAGERFELPDEGGPRLQIKSWATEDACRKLAEMGGQNLDRLRSSAEKRDFRPVPLGVRVSLTLENEISRKDSGNVIGKLAGSDPKLAGEAVLYTAHHDHFGIKEGVRPGQDAIYNGARDNASGCAALLAIARAYAALPQKPRRSVYFATVTAEEQGLLGSEYLAKHPPLPVGRIAANINIDGVNIFGRTHDLTMIGLGKSSLDAIVRDLAAAQGRVVKPDQFPDRGYFYRSDQFNLARVGVPAAYFSEGTDFIGRPAGWGREQIEKWEATHYHQPSDEYRDDWDLTGAVEDVRIDFLLGVTVANADAMPEWNPGDEFDSARKRALAELQPR